MNIHMNDETANFIIKDLQADKGDKIRFFVRLGGCSTAQEGFSLGISKDNPKYPAASLNLQNHEFFIEEEDQWFFDQNDLKVKIQNGEIEYEFVKSET
ncbi:iron-sulfur cluster biosynthesis family protein [Bacillus sp. NEB1478]|uniref:HesB/YadR/YfhF family protein n=1 Tax=Bacillus sp. NEB1478 TaxID=3073816 RepID=UPI0028733D4A|nr:iron-sulfur cluster biosynthesis family protein [Bacillus sp. NEB1478]WNB90262.1 iron-sulfur cluster biosynthesis family protein [Bacillus sp. NEB1478]